MPEPSYSYPPEDLACFPYTTWWFMKRLGGGKYCLDLLLSAPDGSTPYPDFITPFSP